MGRGQVLRTNPSRVALLSQDTGLGPSTIDAQAVSVTYNGKQGSLRVLQDIDLSVRSGEFVSLIGASGCGKSTLLNALAGILPASATVTGDVVLGDGVQLGYLFQRETLLPWRRVIDNVALPLELRGVGRAERRQRAQELISRYGLGGFERHYPAQLSGGMRQRVLLMRTLIYQPELIFLDEPLGSLDAQTRIVLQGELRQIWRESGRTFILVTHDLTEAIALSTRIILLGSNPGHISKEYLVDLPETESQMELQTSAAFVDLEREIWADLSRESKGIER